MLHLNLLWAFSVFADRYDGNPQETSTITDIHSDSGNPDNTGHPPSAGLMLAQRRRRWANIYPALGGCVVLTDTQRK